MQPPKIIVVSWQDIKDEVVQPIDEYVQGLTYNLSVIKSHYHCQIWVVDHDSHSFSQPLSIDFALLIAGIQVTAIALLNGSTVKLFEPNECRDRYFNAVDFRHPKAVMSNYGRFSEHRVDNVLTWIKCLPKGVLAKSPVSDVATSGMWLIDKCHSFDELLDASWKVIMTDEEISVIANHCFV